MADLTVASLLKSSRVFHAQRISLANQKAPDYPAATVAAANALAKRNEAHDLDPDHLDPEWGNDPVPHAFLVQFYERYIKQA